MNNNREKSIVESWQKNVRPWVNAVREGEIASRVEVTNQAIVDTVMARSPETALDLGCGEGWLVRALCSRGIDCLGVDVVDDFLTIAKAGPGRYQQITYEALSFDLLKERFDVIVCNFSLLGEETVERVFNNAPGLLNDNGSLIVQTLHPDGVDDGQQEGWREGNWCGFNDDFCDPAPWYYRTPAGWESLFSSSGFKNIEIIEPLNPKTNRPASVIISGVT